MACQSWHVPGRGRAKRRHLGLIRPFRGGGLIKEATAEDRWEGTVEALGRGSRRSRWGGVHVLADSDPERREENWTGTRGISWVKGKDDLLTFYK